MANAPRNSKENTETKQPAAKETKAAAKPESKPETPKRESKAEAPKQEAKQESRDEIKRDENTNPLLTPQESRKDEVKADIREEKSALARKADALEKAGGDPAKVAELRHQAPAVRTEGLRTTAQQDLGSAPTVRDAEARAADEAAKAEKLSEEETAKGKNPGRRMNATRDVAS